MFVPDVSCTIVYFAFPKCASEWVRDQLKLTWNIKVTSRCRWDDCDIGNCHVRPERFATHHNLDVDNTLFFTVVRNTFDRLVSAYNYISTWRMPFYKGKTFEQFVDMIYVNRSRLSTLQWAWMFLPVETYFGGLLPYVRFFQMDRLCDVAEFMRPHGVVMDPATKVNVSRVASSKPYSAYYTPKVEAKVREVYAWEIERFGYEMPS